jgi:hypothetical protein
MKLPIGCKKCPALARRQRPCKPEFISYCDNTKMDIPGKYLIKGSPGWCPHKGISDL